MRLVRSHRRAAASIVVSLTVALIGNLMSTVPAGAVGGLTMSGSSIPAPVDYFANQWGSSLDFTPGQDFDLSALMFPQGGARALNDGELQTVATPQIVLLRHDPGAVTTSEVRDPNHRTLDANYFTRISFRMHADRDADGGAIGYRTCDSCGDSFRYFSIHKGWHTYDLDMVGTDDYESFQNQGHSVPNGGAAWAGSIGLLFIANGFNLANPSDKPTLAIDDFRIYHPDTPIDVTMPGGGTSELWLDIDNNQSNDWDGAGPGKTGNLIGTFASGSTAHVTSGDLRPGQTATVYAKRGGSVVAQSTLTMPYTSTPNPQVVSPSEAGGADFASEVRGDPWDMNQQSDIQALFNANGSVHDSWLWADGAGALNDPVVLFNLGPKQLDATRYHKFAITMHYDGDFGLEDAPGGGLMGRMVWTGANGDHQQVTKGFVARPGTHTYIFDFRSSPLTDILDPLDNKEWIGWGVGDETFVSRLRFDAHEDPGGRSWRIDDVKMLRDEAVEPTFDIRFRDDAWASGTTAEIFADTDRSASNGLGTKIAGGVPTNPGENVYNWNGAGVGANPYWIHVVLTRAGRAVTGTSTGQVAVGNNGAGDPPGTIETGSWNGTSSSSKAGPTQEQIAAFIKFLYTVKFFCGVARARKIAAVSNLPICVQMLGPVPKAGKAKAKAKAKAKRR